MSDWRNEIPNGWLGYGSDADIEDRIDRAHELGFLLHNKYEVEYLNGGLDGTIVQDVWFFASPDWVQEYHDAGGMWEYRD